MNLSAATETVGNEQYLRIGCPDCREQLIFGARDRDVIVPLLETEIAGKSAAPRVEYLHRDSGLFEEVFLVGVVQDRMLVAVRLDQRRGRVPGRLPVWSLALQHFSDRVRLSGETVGILVAVQQVGCVGLEDGGTARFQHHDRRTGM